MANIFHIDRPTNKITLGTAGTTINIASHTASLLLGLDANKDLESVDLSGVYQPLDAGLTDIAALAVTDGNFIVGNGANWIVESGATARTSIGLGNVEDTTLSTWAGTTNITTLGTIVTGTWAAIDVAVAHGGTGASTAADARTNLGLGEAHNPIFNSLKLESQLYIKEQANAASSFAGYAQIWSKSDTPNTLWFADDAGTSVRIAPQDLQITASPLFAGVTINSGATPTESQFEITANGLGNIALLNYAADNCGIFFDAYYDSEMKSADAGSNFGVRKLTDKLKIVYDSAVAVGATITWNDGFIMTKDGFVGIGVSDPHSKLEVNGAISSGTSTFSTEGPTDNVNVSGVNTLFLDCSANDVTIGGFTGGVNGQVLYVARLCAGAFSGILEHLEGGGSQNIYLHTGADETLDTEYGGWILVCNGTSWFDTSHSKHV